MAVYRGLNFVFLSQWSILGIASDYDVRVGFTGVLSVNHSTRATAPPAMDTYLDHLDLPGADDLDAAGLAMRPRCSAVLLQPLPDTYLDHLDRLDRLDRLGAGDPCTMAPALSKPEPRPAPPPFSRTTIYGAGAAAMPGEAERGLRAAFGPVLDADSGGDGAAAQDLALEVLEKTNYEVVEIVRIDNHAAEETQRAFGQAHGIDNYATVFHGTFHAHAALIERQGPRSACGQRDKYGKGVYAASSVWEAAAYAAPHGVGLHQCFFVASLLQGNTAVFDLAASHSGVDRQGRTLHTTTNPEGTVFCAWYESQLRVTHRVTVRWVPGRPHTPVIHNRIKIYHPDIWQRIKAPAAPVCVSAVPVVATTTPADPLRHAGFGVGDAVTLKSLAVATFQKFNGKRAVIRRLARRNRRVVFYVEVDGEGAAVALAKQGLTAQPPPGAMSTTWLPCFSSQMDHAGALGVAAGSVLGKHGREGTV